MGRLLHCAWVVLLAAACSITSIAESPCTGTGKSQTAKNANVFTGEYCNDEYGFRVILDAGMKVYAAAPPAPDRGFGVNLRRSAGNDAADATSVPYLWVDASYNATDFDTLEDVTNWKIESSCKNGKASVLQTDLAELDEIPADFVRLSCPADGTVREFAVTYRKERNVIYTVEMVTTLAQLKESEAALQRMISNFRFMEFPQP